MISEKKIAKINNVIKDMTFDYDGVFFYEMTGVNIKYQFIITCQRVMMSVGEYYDFLDISVEIVDGDEKATKFLAVVKKLLSPNNSYNAMMKDDYRFKHSLESDISNELQYFFGSDYVRVIVKINISEEYDKKIDEMEIKR